MSTTVRSARTVGVQVLAGVAVVGIAAVAGAAVAALGAVPLIATLGVAFVLATLLAPKATAVLLVCIVASSQMLEPVAAGVKAVDDLGVVAFSAVVAAGAVRQGTLRRFPGDVFFLTFLAFGIAGSMAARLPLRVGIEDAFLLTKGLVFAYAVSLLPWKVTDVRWLGRLAAWILGFLIATTAINVVAPGVWNGVFARSAAATSRGGISVPIGPFNHPSVLAQAFSLSALAIAAHRATFGRSRWWIPMLVVSVLTVGATLRRKAILALLSGMAMLAALDQRSRRFGYLSLVVVGPLLAVLAWDAIASIVSSSYVEYGGGGQQVARTVLYEKAIGLANASFPLGEGFGRYGTFVAFREYGPLYYELGLNYVYGLAPGENFGTDTFWPAIVGEAGWLGAAAYLAGLGALLRVAVRLARRTGAAASPRDRLLRLVALIAAAWWVEFLVESIAAPVYVSPPLYLVFFGVFGVVVALERSSREEAPAAASSDLAARDD